MWTSSSFYNMEILLDNDIRMVLSIDSDGYSNRTLSEFRLWTSANKQKHKQHRKKQQNVGENLNKKTIQGFKKNSCF